MATLIVRQDKIGDLVLATPVAEAVKRAAPGERIYFMCSSYASAVLRGNPHVDQIVEIDPGEGPSSIAKKIDGLHPKPERAIVLFPTLNVALAVFMARIPVRCSTGFRWYQPLFNRLTILRRSKALYKEWEYNLMIARLAFPRIDPCAYRPKVFPTAEAREKAEKLIKGLPKPLILVYPGGGGEKRWPVERFKGLCQKISHIGTPLVVLGPSERDLEKEFDRWPMAAGLNLEELMGLIALCDGMVSNNTGPMHIAAALEKPLVQIFDPRRACNPKRWGHEYKKSSILYPPVPACKGCRPDCPYGDCMDLIDEEWVFRELERCLAA